MTRFKPVGSMLDLSVRKLASMLAEKYRSLNSQKSLELASIRCMLDNLPVPLLELLIGQLTSLLIGRDRQTTAFYASFSSFPIQNVTVLDFSRLFHGFRLKRSQNTMFKEFVVDIVMQATHLSKLVLIGKCTDKILSQLGLSCPRLRELNISLSDDITDLGLKDLLPRSSQGTQGCSSLRLLDLTKCWTISPSGATDLILHLPQLKRLCYINMRAVAAELSEVHGQKGYRDKIYNLDYFECTEPTNQVMDVLSKGIVSCLFPHLSTLKLLLNDQDVGTLVNLKGLLHVELELMNSSVSPKDGFTKFFTHPSSSNLSQIVLLITTFTADCLEMIAKNCSKLQVFKFTGTTLVGEEKLVGNSKYFNKLSTLEFKLYNSEGLYSSDEEEEEEGAATPEIKPELFSFFLDHTVNLVQVVFHVNCARFMSLDYLSRMFAVNPLSKVEKFVLEGPVPLPLGPSAVDLVLSSLDNIKIFNVSRWEEVSEQNLARYKAEAKANNHDLEFF